jgi:predicted nucleotidyltransferase
MSDLIKEDSTYLISTLKEIEREHEIIILYAVNIGSKAHGYSCETSDDDLHFVFLPNSLAKHFSLEAINPIIVDERIVNKIDTSYQGYAGIEINSKGFILQDFLTKLRNDNASVIDMLTSPLIYLNRYNFKERALDLYNSLRKMCNLTKLQGSYWGAFKNALNVVERKLAASCEGKLEERKYYRMLNKRTILALKLFLLVTWLDKFSNLKWPAELPELFLFFKETFTGTVGETFEAFYKELTLTLERLKTNTCSDFHCSKIYKFLCNQEKSYQLLYKKQETNSRNKQESKQKIKPSCCFYDQFYFDLIKEIYTL